MNDLTKKVIYRYLVKKAQEEFGDIPELSDVEDRSRACNLRYQWDAIKNLLTCTIYCGNINHITEAEFLNPDPGIPLLDHEVAIACDCGDFIYGGAMYNLNRVKSLRGPTRYPGRLIVPRIRDPRLQKFLCKHLITVKKFLEGKTLADL